MKKVLLAIDDAPTILTVLSGIFSAEFSVVKKTNGKEAIDWINEGNMPDIIIVDLQMPILNGHEFIDKMEVMTLLKSIPIIVLSGTDDSAERIRCLKKGVSEFVVKPFNPEELRLRTLNLVELNN